MSVLGWDIGGAHVKAALCVGGKLRQAWQLPCPLWKDLKALIDTIAIIAAEASSIAKVDSHALTMTGELSDVFQDRAEGVHNILSIFAGTLPAAIVKVYKHPGTLMSPKAAAKNIQAVASANWSITASWLARRCANALLMDIGSTTTDLVPVVQGEIVALGITDEERLAQGGLLYTGVVRTPVMAVVDALPFAGAWRPTMAEVFATTADVYRLTGQLPPDADQMPSADGRGKTRLESARRLGRMIGVDVHSTNPMQACAHYIAQAQLWSVQRESLRVLSAVELAPGAPIVGAGVGRFLLPILAVRVRRPYVDITRYLKATSNCQDVAADCAPAACLALLADNAARR